MAALFFDLDGTCVTFHTNEWMPGVLEKLTSLHSHGNQIFFITARGPQDANDAWSPENTEALISKLPFPASLTTGVHSPRVLIDDSDIGTVKIKTNDPVWIDAF